MSSVDGLYFDETNNKIYFIESKNSPIKTLNSLRNEIIKKCIHSELLYYFLLSNYCSKNNIVSYISSSNIELILV